uniref:Uncharacterized protein n=1 Tax=Fusarium oxysporum (strain Fo5176) TaxID=660025 RepID=A0A0D2XFV7_FUSOF
MLVLLTGANCTASRDVPSGQKSWFCDANASDYK